ncbi:MAG: TolC family protein [Burkholderiaceae bacterium]
MALRGTGSRALLAALVLGVAGCASLSADGGLSKVTETVSGKVGPAPVWPRTDDERSKVDARVGELLGEPLGLEAAVELALLNNRDLQTAYESLGIAEADLVQAQRLPNPGFSFGRFKRGDEIEIERGFHFNLARLIFMPTVTGIQSRAMARTQRDVAMRVLDLASETRKAWIDAVGARESAHYADQVHRTAKVAAELAQRMAAVGNFSKLQQAREQGFYADALVAKARAQHTVTVTRERLTRLLALYGAQADYRLPDRLPDLPDSVDEKQQELRDALNQRLDLQAARIGVEQMARQLGMVRTNRFINVLEVGVVRNSSNEAPTQTGWEVGFELPIFDWGDARVARAEGLYRQAVNQATQAAINARSQVREAYAGYRTTYDIARHYRDELVPLRQRISEENVYRYNGMLIGVFELLADARAQISTVNGYISALRDHWIAEADLEMALVGKPSISGISAASAGMADAAGAGH